MSAIAAFVGRILLSLIFIVSGANKLIDSAGTEAMITGVGLPAGLAIPTGVFELVAGLAVALGFMTRFFAILLAGFCLVTILFFHNEFQDPMQAAMAMKNLAIAGGLLCLFAHSQMRWSYDSMRLTRKAEIAARDADARVREAELRAATAEARAEAIGETRVAEPRPVIAPVAAAPVVSAPVAAAPVGPAPVVADPPLPERRTVFDRNVTSDPPDEPPIDPRLRP